MKRPQIKKSHDTVDHCMIVELEKREVCPPYEGDGTCRVAKLEGIDE